MTIIVICTSTLIRPSGNGQTTDLDSGAGLFAAVTGPLFAGLKAVGKKGVGGERRREDNSLLERPPRIPISRLTLEFDSGQIVLRMNGRSPFLSINAFG